MANCSAADFSSIPEIADFFHAFPHVNFDFDNVSSLFVPTLADYQQALFLYALGPCLFGVLVFLIFCGHFLASFCSCGKEHKPMQKCIMAMRWVVFLAAVISSGFIIAAFVFNDTVDQGIKDVTTAINNVNDSLVEIQSKADSIKDDMLNMDSMIADWSDIPEEGIVLELRSMIGNVITSVVKIRKVSLPNISEQIRDIEYYRWWFTFGTLFFGILTCLLIIYAALRQSRCGFVAAILLGTFCVVLVWTGSSVDLAAAIGMSDLCVNPKGTVYFYTKKVPALKNTGIVEYYVECPADGANPYQKYAEMAVHHVDEAEDLLTLLANETWIMPKEFQEDLNQCSQYLKHSQANLMVIKNDLNCAYAHQQFTSAQCFVCHVVVVGLADLLLVSLAIGFLMIVILSLVLPILQRIPSSKRRKGRSILDMCGSETPIGTPYQSISENDERTETVPLVPSAPRPSTYDSVYRSMEFHSFEESWRPPRIPLPYDPVMNANIRDTNGEIRSMAF